MKRDRAVVVVAEVEAMAVAAAAVAAMVEVATAAVVAADAATAVNGADVKAVTKDNFRKRLGHPRRFFDALRAGSKRRQEVNPC